ncbi:Uncharacterised protein [BD1-7 clade bacterium]|uniref:IraD/Gp25-like domain-containing protein n=1 Tax=BD1-7 clade bacterium TaxID=2029982 RepID=A0A5S9NXY3_9GAMM|nr:Uncharacterised protein [BD1-7 clade bacterium]CAA0095697.1 Uncharacterised protein [BD1-7 clade bacterium]
MHPRRSPDRMRALFCGELADYGEAPTSARAINQRLHDAVVEDLADFLNTIPFETVAENRQRENIVPSVLNYGANLFTGMMLDHQSLQRIAIDLVERIIDSEPRIVADSLIIEVLDNIPDQDPRTVYLAIEGRLKSEFTDDLRIRTMIDLDTGKVTLREMR